MLDREIAYRQIETDIEEHVSNLTSFISQPSVSPQNVGIAETARMLRAILEKVGFNGTRLVETSGNPVVYGRMDTGARTTVLLYGMYDTMPADEQGWTVDPFAGIIKKIEPFGSTLIARGAINTKGPLMGFLNSVSSILKSGQNLPVNIIFVAEGEEELGSRHLPEFIKSMEDELKEADVLFFPGPSQNSRGKAIVSLGVKGIVYFELEVDGAEWRKGPVEFGIHGSNKAWVDSPT